MRDMSGVSSHRRIYYCVIPDQTALSMDVLAPSKHHAAISLHHSAFNGAYISRASFHVSE